jgi:Zn-dependent M28 family amino/carboxypeptidase
MGYKVTVQKFDVPGGVSRNLVARAVGNDRRVVVISGHLDTRSTTPGANDDAAGCAIVLEIARILAREQPRVSVEFTFFGAEEYNDGAHRDHHRGSRYRVAHLTKAQRANIIGMISLDVVGYGTRLYARTMGVGPRSMSDYLLRIAAKTGVGLKYSKDPGPTGWSDHEPYEKAGIPAVWLERLQDPQYHRMGDTAGHLRSSALSEAGKLVLHALGGLAPAEVRRIARR